MRVAIVHDWLTGMRGGERVLEALLDLYPSAEIFTLVQVPGAVSKRIESRPIHAPLVNRLPGVQSRYRWDPAELARSARPFGRDRFLDEMRREVDATMAGAPQSGGAA